MTNDNVEQYLNRGIYGPKEIKPDEKRLYLGTFRERVIITLTKVQVGRNEVYEQVIKLMEENRNAQLLLNGHMNYKFLSKYVKIADDFNVSYKVVTNKDYDSKYGLVLAHDYAINKEIITIEEDDNDQENETDEDRSFLKRLFGKDNE